MKRAFALALALAGCVLDAAPGLRVAPLDVRAIEIAVDGRIVLQDGISEAIFLQATAVLGSGERLDVTEEVAWLTSEPTLAAVAPPENPGAPAELVTNGLVGGELDVVAELGPPLIRQPPVAVTTVRLATRLVEGPFDADDVDRQRALLEERPTMEGDAGLLQPLAAAGGIDAAIPTAFGGFEVIWAPGDVGDVVHVCLRKGGDLSQACLALEADGAGAPDVRIERGFIEGGESDDQERTWTLRGAPFVALAETSPETPVTVELTRLTEGRVVREVRRLRLVPTRGVQSWIFEATDALGRLLRTNSETGSRDVLLPAPFGSFGAGECQGCHVVSGGGDALLTNVGGYFEGTSFAGLANVETLRLDPAQGIEGPDAPVWFPAASASGRSLVTATPGGFVFVLGVETNDEGLDAAEIRPLTLGARLTMPAFRPDDEERLLAVRVDAAPEDGPAGRLSFEASALVPFALDGSVGEALLRGDALAEQPEGGRALSYPPFTPAGARLVFVHGPWGGLRDLAGEPSPAAMYWTNGDASEPPVRLGRALPGEASASWPTFLPDTTDDAAQWMTFTSRAPVGHERTDLYQLWVTRVRRDAEEGEDPTSPPVHLPFQSPFAHQLRAQFVDLPIGRCSSSLDCPEGRLCRPLEPDAPPVCAAGVLEEEE